MKIKSKLIINYFVLLLIVLSGSVFFSLKYAKGTQGLLIVSSICLVLYNLIRGIVKISFNNIITLFILIIMFSVNFLLNIQNGVVLNRLLFLISMLGCIFFLKEQIDKVQFKRSYVKILKWICIISLICYSLSWVIPFTSFPFYREEVLGTNVFKFTFYHNWGWGSYNNRNSGFFWEPGAFQCYINLAILFIFMDSKHEVTNSKIPYLILFICTLITTQSTTAYLIVSIIIFYCTLTKKIYFISRKRLVNLFISIILCISSIFLFNSNVVKNKFDEDIVNASYDHRKNHFYESIDIIKNYPIKGLGYNSEKQVTEQFTRQITNNSNGLLLFIIQFGLVISFIFIFMLYRGIKDTFEVNKIDSIFILFIFLLMYSSESIILLPIWVLFTFKFSEFKGVNKNIIDNKTN